MRLLLRITGIIVLIYLLPAGCMFAQHKVLGSNASWWDLRRDSSKQAPPAETDEAIIQVYAARAARWRGSARAARWRGSFGVHTWVAAKRQSENRYTRMEAMQSDFVQARLITTGLAINPFYYAIFAAVKKSTRSLIVCMLRPSHNYREWRNTLSISPSKTGAQLSFKGYGGLLVGLEEGLEINILGFSAGIDLYPPALKLPAIGRIGFSDYRRFNKPDSPAP